MKIFVSRDIQDVGIEMLKSAGHSVEVCKLNRPLTQEELIEYSQNSDALLCVFTDKIDKKFLNECRNLKAIVQFAVGYDNIDVKEATKLKIPVANTPDILSESTADIAFLLLQAVARKAFYLHKIIEKGGWDFFKPKAHLGIELRNKTLGIFGLGRIGFEMAKRCKSAFDMNILYCNRTQNINAEKYLDAKKVSFEKLLADSDIVSAHCSLSAETNGIFNLNVFKQMKSTAIFINTARGAIHNEPDLIYALNNKIIWGAGLDVANPEPMKPYNPLLNMPNVAVLPHIGSATEETRDKMSILCAESMIKILNGEQIDNVVNKEIYL